MPHFDELSSGSSNFNIYEDSPAPASLASARSDIGVEAPIVDYAVPNSLVATAGPSLDFQPTTYFDENIIRTADVVANYKLVMERLDDTVRSWLSFPETPDLGLGRESQQRIDQVILLPESDLVREVRGRLEDGDLLNDVNDALLFSYRIYAALQFLTTHVLDARRTDILNGRSSEDVRQIYLALNVLVPLTLSWRKTVNGESGLDMQT